MTQYNFMSGSSIDNVSQFIFDAFLSEKCYLGMSKGKPDTQWGINTLVMLDNQSFPTYVAKSGDSSSSYKFFDSRSVSEIAGATPTNQKVSIGYVADTDINFDNVMFLSPDDIGVLKLLYIGKDWAVIQGLSKYYYNYMSPSTTGSYYLFNYQELGTGAVVAAKIMEKTIISVPYYTSNGSIFYKATSGSEYTNVASGLQRTINFLGETNISGLLAPEAQDQDSIFNDTYMASNHKIQLNTAYSFVFKDDLGTVIIDNLTYVDPNELDPEEIYTEISSLGNSQKYITFKYPFNSGEYQYIKLLVGQNQLDELGIWSETLPYDSVIPISDSNPPSLDVSYLKNPLVSSSLFDVNGFTKIKTADFDFVKEVNNTIEETNYINAGFDIELIELTGSPSIHTGIVRTVVSNGDNVIQLFDFSGFVVGDVIFIKNNFYDPLSIGLNYTVTDVDYTNGANSITLNQPVVLSVQIPVNAVLSSDETTVSALIKVAKTKDKSKALKYGFFNVMISKEVELTGANSPTEGIYRQLFIAYKPSDKNGIELTNDVYNGDSEPYGINFNKTTWTNENGLILYIANKVPVYRKWASENEQFKIII